MSISISESLLKDLVLYLYDVDSFHESLRFWSDDGLGVLEDLLDLLYDKYIPDACDDSDLSDDSIDFDDFEHNNLDSQPISSDA
jgi:hypothetical protein